MYKTGTLLGLLAAVFLLIGCAGIMNDRSDSFTFVSQERGTLFYVDGGLVGEDQVSVRLQRGETHRIWAQKTGCKPAYAATTDKFDKSALLNPLFIPVDYITGAIWEPAQKYFVLTPLCKTPY